MVLRFIAIALTMQGLTPNVFSAIRPRSPSSCGSSHDRTRSGRIVGGTECFEGEFPWMVSFKSDGTHFCGGFVIAEKFLLSAAHCFMNQGGVREISGVTASIGEFSLLTPEETKDIPVPIEDIIVHPSYSPSGREFDIALVKLKKSVHIHPKVEPICLPLKMDVHYKEMKNITTAGWGKTSYYQSFTDWEENMDFLRKAQVNLWDTEECRNVYKSFSNFPTSSFICAGTKEQQSCIGDSGSPLMFFDSQKWVSIGLVSVGNRCGLEGRPSVYTYLVDFVPWITSVINS